MKIGNVNLANSIYSRADGGSNGSAVQIAL